MPRSTAFSAARSTSFASSCRRTSRTAARSASTSRSYATCMSTSSARSPATSCSPASLIATMSRACEESAEALPRTCAARSSLTSSTRPYHPLYSCETCSTARRSRRRCCGALSCMWYTISGRASRSLQPYLANSQGTLAWPQNLSLCSSKRLASTFWPHCWQSSRLSGQRSKCTPMWMYDTGKRHHSHGCSRNSHTESCAACSLLSSWCMQACPGSSVLSRPHVTSCFPQVVRWRMSSLRVPSHPHLCGHTIGLW
mmetsp:Transcript_65457/g.206870  ORF Transcript_65457/g.206870 Transcript_65457/m.206870 type:complete len:256 (-) Transcript_65457:700-1467(-)